MCVYVLLCSLAVPPLSLSLFCDSDSLRTALGVNLCGFLWDFRCCSHVVVGLLHVLDLELCVCLSVCAGVCVCGGLRLECAPKCACLIIQNVFALDLTDP